MNKDCRIPNRHMEGCLGFPAPTWSPEIRSRITLFLLCEKSQGASKGANIQCWAPVKVHISQFFFFDSPERAGSLLRRKFRLRGQPYIDCPLSGNTVQT